MMKLGVITFKRGMLALAAMVGAIGIAVVAHSQAQAKPVPECGPTRQWTCALPGCPDCYEVQFEGTVCEKAAFEKKTGRVCTPE